jgi:hypothetical protein
VKIFVQENFANIIMVSLRVQYGGRQVIQVTEGGGGENTIIFNVYNVTEFRLQFYLLILYFENYK